MVDRCDRCGVLFQNTTYGFQYNWRRGAGDLVDVWICQKCNEYITETITSHKRSVENKEHNATCYSTNRELSELKTAHNGLVEAVHKMNKKLSFLEGRIDYIVEAAKKVTSSSSS